MSDSSDDMEFYSGFIDDEDDFDVLEKQLEIAIAALKYYSSRDYDGSTANQALFEIEKLKERRDVE